MTTTVTTPTDGRRPLAAYRAVSAVEPHIHFRQDGLCWPDCPGCQVKAALLADATCCDFAEATGGDTHDAGCAGGAK